MQYKEVYNLYGTGPQWYVFRLNSLYDPDYTGTGKQPMYFDQLANLYERYRVFGCSVKITFVSSVNSYPQLIGFTAENITTSPDSLPQLGETPFGKLALITPTSSARMIKTMSKYYEIKQTLGYQSNLDDDLAAVTSTNPAQILFLHVGVDTLPEGNTTGCQLLVELKFVCRFYDLALLGESLSTKKIEKAQSSLKTKR